MSMLPGRLGEEFEAGLLSGLGAEAPGTDQEINQQTAEDIEGAVLGTSRDHLDDDTADEPSISLPGGTTSEDEEASYPSAAKQITGPGPTTPYNQAEDIDEDEATQYTLTPRRSRLKNWLVTTWGKQRAMAMNDQTHVLLPSDAELPAQIPRVTGQPVILRVVPATPERPEFLALPAASTSRTAKPARGQARTNLPALLPPPTLEDFQKHRTKLAEAQERGLHSLEIQAQHLGKISSRELPAISVVNPVEYKAEFLQDAVQAVQRRAKERFQESDLDWGNVRSYLLGDDLAMLSFADNPGVTLLRSILEGRIPGISDRLWSSLAYQSASYDRNPQVRHDEISLYESDTAKAEPFMPLHRAVLDGSYPMTIDGLPDNKRAGMHIQAAIQDLARQSSAEAHRDIFEHIRLLSDGTVEHRSPYHPEKAIKEHDFDCLVASLDIPVARTFKLNGVEFGVYDPLDGSKDSPIDRIFERAGQENPNIINLKGFGNGAFLALIPDKENEDGEQTGGFIVLAHHPLIPGYEDTSGIEASVEHLGLKFRNIQPEPETTEADVIIFPLRVLQVAADGYELLTEKFEKYKKYPFKDPRPILRRAHRRVMEDIIDSGRMLPVRYQEGVGTTMSPLAGVQRTHRELHARSLTVDSELLLSMQRVQHETQRWPYRPAYALSPAPDPTEEITLDLSGNLRDIA